VDDRFKNNDKDNNNDEKLKQPDSWVFPGPPSDKLISFLTYYTQLISIHAGYNPLRDKIDKIEKIDKVDKVDKVEKSEQNKNIFDEENQNKNINNFDQNNNNNNNNNIPHNSPLLTTTMGGNNGINNNNTVVHRNDSFNMEKSGIFEKAKSSLLTPVSLSTPSLNVNRSKLQSIPPQPSIPLPTLPLVDIMYQQNGNQTHNQNIGKDLTKNRINQTPPIFLTHPPEPPSPQDYILFNPLRLTQMMSPYTELTPYETLVLFHLNHQLGLNWPLFKRCIGQLMHVVIPDDEFVPVGDMGFEHLYYYIKNQRE
jgi:hypothetical protein